MQVSFRTLAERVASRETAVSAMKSTQFLNHFILHRSPKQILLSDDDRDFLMMSQFLTFGKPEFVLASVEDSKHGRLQEYWYTIPAGTSVVKDREYWNRTPCTTDTTTYFITTMILTKSGPSSSDTSVL